jgi:hypothetical protein
VGELHLEIVVDVPEQVLQYNCGLRLVLEMCFLQAMGFSTEEIASFARGCETYRQISRRFFHRPALPGAASS